MPLIPDDLPSPGRKYQKLLIEKWLASCPEPVTLKSPEEVAIPEEGIKVEKFVMVQVFTRDSLIKSDLIALPADRQSTEICISHVEGKQQPRSNTEDFR